MSAAHGRFVRLDTRHLYTRKHKERTAERRPYEMAEITIRELNDNDALDFQNLRLRDLKEHLDAFGSTYERESEYYLEFVAERLRLTAESPNNFTLGAHRQEALIGVVGFRRIAGEETAAPGLHLGHVRPIRRAGTGHRKGPYGQSR